MFARVLMAGLLAGWIGCGKSPTSAPSAAEPTPGQAASPTPATRAVPPAAAVDQAQMTVLLGELTQVVRKYSVEKQRVPKSLEELVANGYLSGIPPAPAGKRFVINKNLQVDLAGR